MSNIERVYNHPPTSSLTLQGASPATEQSSWLFRTPLMQQVVLSRPATAPAAPQLAPPHWVHSMGQQALPLSFSPSKPGNPLLHSEAGSVLVFWRSRRGRRATWSPQIVFNIQKTWYKCWDNLLAGIHRQLRQGAAFSRKHFWE